MFVWIQVEKETKMIRVNPIIYCPSEYTFQSEKGTLMKNWNI